MTMTPPTDATLSPIKRALLEIRELRSRLSDAEAAAREPIAIVGAGLRFPGGVDDLEALWRLLSDGGDAIVPIPAGRWDAAALYDADPDAPGRMITREGGFIDGVDGFDAEFFGISPREAESMDPQQRIVLETAWHAIEDAGIAPDSLHASRTGVFLGVCNNDYGRLLFAHPDRIDPYFSPGNAGSVVAGRVSYFLGLHGPSIAIDTACSSSLVAVHLAAQSLRSGECDLALAGGVNLILSPEMNINFSKARMMAPDGRCKTFDAAADGYVRGEGCGVIVLKRLRDCTAADRVLAVVRGSAINQDGRSGGLTAPNGPAQEAVLRDALASAGIDGSQVAYVEAHGTGTPLGDPIEAQALGAVLGAGRDAARPLPIGSIKTNLGHLEAAAGVAGLLKVVLALRHRTIPPHLHLRTPTSHVDWPALGLTVPTSATPLPDIGGRRLAGVSSFGFSGTNAHVVLEEAPAVVDVDAVSGRPQHLLALSARDAAGLDALVAAYAARLADTSASLADVCHAANVGRTPFAHRLSVRAASMAQMATSLRAIADGQPARGVLQGVAAERPRVAFLFTGGGAQSAGMARGLYASAPVFRRVLDEADAILEPLIGRRLVDLLHADAAEGLLDQTRYGQPALVAVEIALAALWRSWGVEPVAVLGHSLGEYAAAHVAGAISLEDALRIVVQRTREVDTVQAAGGMATIFATAADVEASLRDSGSAASIAAFNGPEQVVISGPLAAVDAACAAFERRGVRVARLRVAYASHSSMMDPVLDAFEKSLQGVRFSEPRVAFVSNLTGQTAGADLVGRPAYWRDHLRQPVRFEQGIRALDALGVTHYLEIGPHPVLVGMGAACIANDRAAWLPSLRREHDDWDVMLDTLQAFHAAGVAVDWAGFDAGGTHRPVDVPRYPFQRRRHWADWAAWRAEPNAAPVAAAAWAAVTRSLDVQSQRGPIGVDLGGYRAKWAALARVADAHAADVLRGAGLFRAGEPADLDAVLQRLGAASHYRHLVARWLARLTADGQLQRTNDAWVSPQGLAQPDLPALWNDAQARLHDSQPLLDYVRHCADLLGPVLAGTHSPLETLFPGGGFALADGLYRRSATMRYVNDLAATAAQAFADARGARPLRVLEIGAGTGGTSAAVLSVLPPATTRYRFTDVSDFFLDRARTEFAAHGFIDYATLDLDREIAGQGVAAGGFDLVLASNAVHATRDLRAALRRLRELVAPGGVLLLVESTVHLAWFDITTGLIEGWQHFDDDLRTDNPLLPAATWLQALRDAGFEAADAWPRDGAAAADIGQHVIVARVAGEPTASASIAAMPVTQSATVARAAETPAQAGQAQALARRDAILAALPDDRHALLREFVRERVIHVLKLDPAHPPARNDRLMDIGFDSLMAVQLRNQLGNGLALDKPLPATVMFDHPTIDALSSFILERLQPEAPPAAAAQATPDAPAALGAAAIAAMSDAEIEALLLSRLDN